MAKQRWKKVKGTIDPQPVSSTPFADIDPSLAILDQQPQQQQQQQQQQ